MGQGRSPWMSCFKFRFTEGPPPTNCCERNRAGCNISDCGNISRRKQRMKNGGRKKLLDLARKSSPPRGKNAKLDFPGTAGKLRMKIFPWTPPGLGADGYEEHGSEKKKWPMFERLEWWQGPRPDE